jgi:non-specific serine/threonine protein kinase
LISGLQYLHSQGIVHLELKPTDLIVCADGSIKICGYLTNIFAEFKYTQASQVAAPSYMAPEMYEDRTTGIRTRDPRTDTFSFSLILFEILFESKVFPSTLSGSIIMRKAMSAKAIDRPIIPTTIHPILQTLIAKGWSTLPAKRPTFDAMWKQLRDIEFKFFPNVQVQFTPLERSAFKCSSVLEDNQS